MKRVFYYMVIIALIFVSAATGCKSKKNTSITQEERARMDADQQRHRRLFDSETR